MHDSESVAFSFFFSQLNWFFFYYFRLLSCCLASAMRLHFSNNKFVWVNSEDDNLCFVGQQQNIILTQFSSTHIQNSNKNIFFIFPFFIISTLSPSYCSWNPFRSTRHTMKINRSVHFPDWPIYVYVCNHYVVWLVFTSSNWEPYSAMIPHKSDSICPVQQRIMDHRHYTCYHKRYDWTV